MKEEEEGPEGGARLKTAACDLGHRDPGDVNAPHRAKVLAGVGQARVH